MDEKLKKIAELDRDILSLKNTIKDHQGYLKEREEERGRLAAAAANEMVEAGCTSSDTGGIRWSIRNTPQKVIITDETLLPPKYIKETVTKSPNKTLLKNAIKNGAEIQGAYLDNGSVTLVSKGIIK
jgi:hypothetical protein